MSSESQTVAVASPHCLNEGTGSASFLGLLVTQFLGALNDNVFRWLVVPIGKDMVASPQGHKYVLATGLFALVLPFIFFAAPAGWLADRFSKRNVIVGCKVAEVLLMVLGVATIVYGSMYLMFCVLFLLGVHSALFSPSKFGSIPEIVRPDRLSAANGLVGMTTILAIVLGTIGGGYLYLETKPQAAAQVASADANGADPGAGQPSATALSRGLALAEKWAVQPARLVNWWLPAAMLVGVAGAGLAASLAIRRLPVANPRRPFPVNPAAQTVRDLGQLTSRRPILLAAVGSALFWSLGGLVQINVDDFTRYSLVMGQEYVGWLLAALALGVGIGNVVAGAISRGASSWGSSPWRPPASP